MKEKGSVEWFDVYPDVLDREVYQGHRVGIEHIGPQKVRQWGYKQQALAHEEQGRIAKRREQFTQAQLPDIYEEDYRTPEGLMALEAYYESILAECFAGYTVDGAEKFEGKEERAAEAMRLDFGFALGNLAARAQNLEPTTPLVKGPGSTRAKPRSGNKSGPGNKRSAGRAARGGNGVAVQPEVGSP